MKRLFFIFVGLATLVGFSSYEPVKKDKKSKICKSCEKTDRHERKW